MSVGFSVGDFVSAADLTYRLINALRETRGAGEEYRAAIDELGCHQNALMRVSHLERNKLLPPETLNAASHLVMQSMNLIHGCLEQTKKYDDRLGRNGVSGFRHNARKVRWTLLKADDMRKLRESLQSRNASLQTLLQCASLEKDNPFSQHISDNKQLDASVSPPANCLVLENSRDSAFEDDLPGKVASDQPERQFNLPPVEEIPSLLEDITGPPPSSLFSISSFSAEQLRSLIYDRKSRESEILAVADLLRTLTRLGDYQLPPVEHPKLTQLLDDVCQDPKNPTIWAPIKFKDAVGRTFSFPWDLCRTWKGMEELIKQAFLHVEIIGPHVHQGHYELVGPDGDIILPQVWETVIRPDWSITMHMWPLPEPKPKEEPPPPDPHTVHGLPKNASRQALKRTRSKKVPRVMPDPHMPLSPPLPPPSMAPSPALEGSESEASASLPWAGEGDDTRVSTSSSETTTPDEAGIEMGPQMRSTSSTPQTLHSDNEDAVVQVSSTPREGLSPLLPDAAIGDGDHLQDHVGDCDNEASV